MTSRVNFKARSGGAVEGEISEPAGSGKAPAVVLIQEWWGVNDHIKSLAKRLSDAGFLTLAPDLYHGTITKDAGEAYKLMTALDFGKAVDEIAGAVAYLREHPRGNGKVGVIGFCMGGALSFATAVNVPDIDAAVAFYGVPDATKTDYSKVRAPIMAHFASRDQHVPPSKGEAIKAQLDARNHPMELYVYDADHAFANDTRPEVYNPEAAKEAWGRSIKFLHQNVG